MSGQDGCQGKLEAIIRTVWEIANSFDQGNFSFVREFQEPVTVAAMLEGLAANLSYLKLPY